MMNRPDLYPSKDEFFLKNPNEQWTYVLDLIEYAQELKQLTDFYRKVVKHTI